MGLLRDRLGLALFYVSCDGLAAGKRVGDIFFGNERGPEWVRWASRCVAIPGVGYLDAARRGAARVLLETIEPPTADELAQRDLDDELLCLAALLAKAGNNA